MLGAEPEWHPTPVSWLRNRHCRASSVTIATPVLSSYKHRFVRVLVFGSGPTLVTYCTMHLKSRKFPGMHHLFVPVRIGWKKKSSTLPTRTHVLFSNMTLMLVFFVLSEVTNFMVLSPT
jgi:hypothetical protein